MLTIDLHFFLEKAHSRATKQFLPGPITTWYLEGAYSEYQKKFEYMKSS
jgi:hypothetical protein